MTITKEGSLASFYTVNKAPIKHLKVYFSPKQNGSGDPSPENIRSIEGHSSLNVTHCGRNLLSCDTFTGYNANGIKATYSTTNNGEINEIYIKGTSTKTHNLFINLNYTQNQLKWPAYGRFSTYAYSNAANIAFIANDTTPKDTNNIAVQDNVAKWKTYNLSHQSQNTSEWVRIQLMPHDNNKDTIYDTTIKPLVCIEADKGCEYEPYKGQTYTLDWTNDIGTVYGGYIDLITGELVQTEALKSVTGDEDWYISSGIANTCAYRPTLLSIGTQIDGYYTPISNKLQGVGKWGTAINECTINSSGNFYFGAPEELSTSEAVNNWVKSIGGFEFTYPIAPITYQLTPTELQTLLGRNNIWSNADRVEVEYDLAETNDELYKRRSIILAQSPHLESTSGTIAHFNTDLNNNLKSAKFYFNPIQAGSGNPSPSNVRTITGINEIKITHSGVNILQCDTFTDNSLFTGHRNINNEIDYITVSGTTDTYNCFRNLNYIPNECRWPPNGAYAVNAYTDDATLIFGGSDYTPDDRAGRNWRTLTSGWRIYDLVHNENNTFELIRIQMLPYGSSQGKTYNTTVYPMVCLAEDAGCEFEPYKGSTITINWSNIGTIYGGYLDLINGQLVKTKEYKLLTNPNKWIEETTYSNVTYIYDEYIARKQYDDDSITGLLCTCLPTTYSSTVSYGRWRTATSGCFGIKIINNQYTLEDIKQLTSEQKIAITYDIAPVVYQLTPQQMKTLKGTNNIWSSANGPVEIKYWTH